MASDRPETYPNPGPHAPMPNRNSRMGPQINLTEQEIKALRDCFKEAFWYRSLPLFASCFLGIRFLNRAGILRKASPLVATFRDIGMLIASGFVGRVMYSEECRRKIMELPNSRLAEAIKKNKKGSDIMTYLSSQQDEADQAGALESSEFDSRQADYHRKDRGDFMGKMEDTNERYRPSSMDDEVRFPVDQSESEQPKIYNSYEQLRQQNRSEYERKHRIAPSAPPTSEQSRPPRPSSFFDSSSSSTTQSKYRTNQWGDVIEE